MCTEESEPIFRTEPSSRETRARALGCVFTTSSQSTVVFAEAAMDFAPREMFTEGIMREISPARWGGDGFCASESKGIATEQVRTQASAIVARDFMFIEDS